MIHVSGFLKLVYKQNEGSSKGSDHSHIGVPPNEIDNYQVVGLVAECHLIESPVIMELTVQHSTFTGVTSMDLKFTSVDTRYIYIWYIIFFNIIDKI